MPMKKTRPKRDRMWSFDRSMLRGAFASLFWGVISDRRKRGELTLQALAESLRLDKSAVSRWFGDPFPNWTLNTIADLTHVLDLELEVTARDRRTGLIYTAAGLVSQQRGGASSASFSAPMSGQQTSQTSDDPRLQIAA
jgi:hypothetical protein